MWEKTRNETKNEKNHENGKKNTTKFEKMKKHPTLE